MSNALESAIRQWLLRVATAETLPSGVVAFNIGLFETPEGFEAHLSGASRHDALDDSWAAEEVLRPAERYLPLPHARYGLASRESAQAAVVSAVRAALASPALEQSFFASAHAITVGFDDGDMQRVA